MKTASGQILKLCNLPRHAYLLTVFASEEFNIVNGRLVEITISIFLGENAFFRLLHLIAGEVVKPKITSSKDLENTFFSDR